MTRAADRLRTGLSFDDVLLVPQRSPVRSRAEVDTAVELPRGVRLAIPVISANTQWCTGGALAAAMARCGGLGFVHRMQTVAQQTGHVAAAKHAVVGPDAARAALDRAGRPLVGAATGVAGDFVERAAALVDSGADALLVDVAHGHSDHAIEAVAKLRSAHPDVLLVAGNVATDEGVRDLAAAGADVVKVGIGPGGVCTTRLVAGSGVPQLTAVLDCAEAAEEAGCAIIADGGVRTAGDIAKALAAGASAVMLGSLLAGCDESEALPVERDGVRSKSSRGFATLGMANTLRTAAGERLTAADVADYVPEGVEATFPRTGSAAATLRQLVGGLQSAMSYSGAHDVARFQERARFIRVTPAGRAENRPHALDRAPLPAPDYRGEVMNR
ncbi:IMP dehydrogenase [Saccharothrix australiensis]|uniref:Inosine-5'-monophosphate dehydrogenase n=1 Tax=Saccharothrix australiensis TaxID=2072 RepID=A0A495VZK9_9PSEU|nr:IMP dehydrogenase [Saccharothrix australiensis]RKT53825.1 inosine-5'-monophosphate dehydrogenase [Saccharothrix australiensis]